MRGILVAGAGPPGLWPATAAMAAPLLPVYDKPLIYYPLSALLSAGIRRILIIAAPGLAPRLQQLLGGGEQWGVSLSYALAAAPLGGLARALVIGAEFTGRRPLALALADRICYGRGLAARLQKAAALNKGARVFAWRSDAAPEPQAVGLAPGYALAGLSFYDDSAADRVREMRPAAGRRIEIDDLNRAYLGDGRLRVEALGRAVKMLHITGPDSLLQAARSVKTAQQRRAAVIGSPEESAWRMNFIGDEQLLALAAAAGENPYAGHLRRLPERRHRERQ